MKSGPASASRCMTVPAINGPTTQPAFLATFVIPLAYVRADAGTTAITYDCRVGTSISTSASRARNSAAAIPASGAAA